jgi:hypothetical protein
MSDYRGVGLLGCRTIGVSDYRGVGLSRCRAIGVSDYRGVGLLGCQTIGAAPMSYIRHGHFVPLLTSQTKDYKIGMRCFFANHTTLKSRDKD